MLPRPTRSQALPVWPALWQKTQFIAKLPEARLMVPLAVAVMGAPGLEASPARDGGRSWLRRSCSLEKSVSD